MRKLSQISEDAQFYEQFASLIETTKTVALSEYRALEKKVGTFEKLAFVVDSFFGLMRAGNVDHPFVDPGDRPLGVIAITSDAGLSGGLDTRVAAAAVNELRGPKDRLIMVGRRGLGYVRELEVAVKEFPGVQDGMRLKQALGLVEYVLKEVMEERLGPVNVVYAHPFSIVSQKVRVVNLLPCSKDMLSPTVSSTRGRDVIAESSPASMVEYLVSVWCGQKVYDFFGLGRLAEVGARFMHAEDCSHKIKEISEKLKLEYLRAKHEKIDQQMRELAAARA